jgi:membrane protease YdiL (CAAX protease family)
LFYASKIINFSQMAYGLFHTARPFTKILLVLFLMVTSYLILFGTGILLAWPIFGISPPEVIGVLENQDAEGHIRLLKFLQVLYSLGVFLLPALLAGFLIQNDTWEFLRADRKIRISLAILVILLMLASIPWINYLGFLNEKLSLPEQWSEWMDRIKQSDEKSWNLMKSYLATGTVWGLLFNLFMISLIPAIGEEFLFRGTLQRIFQEWFRNGHLAVWTAAVLFSLAHYQFLGFMPRIILGALFGYIFLWTGNIWLPVLAHFVNNAVAVVYYNLFLVGKLGIDPQQLGMQHNSVLYIFGSLLLTAIGIAVIRQVGKMSADSHPA